MPVLRPGPTGLKRVMARAVMGLIPIALSFCRRFWRVPHFGKFYIAALHDDVREVFATDRDFGVVYKPKLDVIMNNQPFILGLPDGEQYRAALNGMRRVARRDDLPALAAKVEAMAEAIVAQANGQLEVVDALIRRVTFGFIQNYLGIADRPDLQAWCTRLFEYQFVSSDAPLVAEVKQIAPALRAHIMAEIARCISQPAGRDDVMARCLAFQANGEAGFSDDEICTNLMGLLVGGPPQPPMVVPQALEQLLRRPEALKGAQDAARANDDAALASYVIEAMRFDPLAPGLPRLALRDCVIAAGTSHEKKIPAGATVFAAFASAMMDSRRLADPGHFNSSRLPYEYIHFGYGVHQCFGLHINQATLHLMLKPLLQRENLRRAPGSAGRLRKSGAFAEALIVEYD